MTAKEKAPRAGQHEGANGAAGAKNDTKIAPRSQTDKPTFEERLAALEPLISAGFELFPLRVGGKEPLHKGWREQPALTKRQIERYLRTDHNLGVRQKPGEVVVDVDKRNFAEGETWSGICLDYGLDLSGAPCVETGTKGLHFYMRVDPAMELRGKLCPGVDIKKHGGYVVAPGSIHPNGKPYTWIDPADLWLGDVPDAPSALLDAITRKSDSKSPVKPGKHTAEEVASMLEALDPTDFGDNDDWLDLMMACHHASAGEARDEFVTWSTGDPEYADHGERIEKRWDSLRADRASGVTYKTLYKLLIDAGHGDAIPRSAAEEDFDGIEDLDGSFKRAKGLTYQTASDVTPEPIEWLWPRRFAVGKLSCIAGHPDEGKSQILCAMASVVSRGGEWPDGGKAERGDVVILSAEDSAADTIRPRLEAAGADLTRCHIVDALVTTRDGKRMFNLADDLKNLTALIEQLPETKMLSIDPISAYLGGRDKADSYRNSEVRALLAPFADWADKHRIAGIFVSHFNKGGTGRALTRVTDSLAFTALARSVWLAVPEPTDDDMGPTGRRLFVRGKLNIASDPGGLAYRIEEVRLPSGIGAPRVVWDGTTTVSADEALAPRKKPAVVMEAAETFLLDILARGPMLFSEIEARAEAEGHVMRTIRRAKESIGVRATKREGDGKWQWALP